MLSTVDYLVEDKICLEYIKKCPKNRSPSNDRRNNLLIITVNQLIIIQQGHEERTKRLFREDHFCRSKDDILCLYLGSKQYSNK